MYADREEAEATRSVKERLNGSTGVDSSRRRTVTGKRQRQDDKWEHDLFDDEPQNSNRKVGTRDLRLKLQKKGLQSRTQSGAPGSGVRDLRERLSGVTSTPSSAKSEVQRPKQASEATKPARRSGAVEASVPATKSSARPTQRRKTTHKDAMESFLDSLGLEKYSITFQAEEVDMAALKHMTDEDLKAMGIPMGPRKKILLALESKD